MKRSLDHVGQTVDRIAKSANQQESRALQTEIEQWLGAPDPSTNHNEALRLRHECSGDWIFESKAFKSWWSKTFPLVWLHGMSGCGKTVLSSTIVEHLRLNTSPEESVLYFYFDVQDSRKRRLDDVLRSLIKQLCYAQHSTRHHVEQLYRFCNEGHTQPTTLQLQHCFADMCKERSITIVLDALDESVSSGTSRDEVLRWIKDANRVDQVRMIVTSRPEHDIKIGLAGSLTDDAALEIAGSSLNEDIKTFIHASVYDYTGPLRRWHLRAQTSGLLAIANDDGAADAAPAAVAGDDAAPEAPNDDSAAAAAKLAIRLTGLFHHVQDQDHLAQAEQHDTALQGDCPSIEDLFAELIIPDMQLNPRTLEWKDITAPTMPTTVG